MWLKVKYFSKNGQLKESDSIVDILIYELKRLYESLYVLKQVHGGDALRVWCFKSQETGQTHVPRVCMSSTPSIDVKIKSKGTAFFIHPWGRTTMCKQSQNTTELLFSAPLLLGFVSPRFVRSIGLTMYPRGNSTRTHKGAQSKPPTASNN
jgi:hypothetical protein